LYVVVNPEVVGLDPWVNLTIVSYNISAVKIYYATSGLLRFDNKDIFLYLENALVYYTAGVVVVQSQVTPTTPAL
jgi:hypothetical protein